MSNSSDLDSLSVIVQRQIDLCDKGIDLCDKHIDLCDKRIALYDELMALYKSAEESLQQSIEELDDLGSKYSDSIRATSLALEAKRDVRIVTVVH